MIKCSNGSAHQHATALEVRACYGQRKPVATAKVQAPVDPFAGTPVATTAEPAATEKQVSFIQKLRQERGLEPIGSFDLWTKKAASYEISRLLDMPKEPKPQAASSEEPEDGIYYVEATNEIYKVYKMVHGSGRQGVKRLDHGDQEGRFTYLGLASRKLPKEARKMSLEEAKAFGRLYGFCIRCGATLTDEESIAAGIGPVCAGKF